MPQNGMNYEGGRRGPRRYSCKAYGQVPGTDLVNGVVVPNGHGPAAATRTTDTAPAGTLNGTKPQCVANGFNNHGYKGKSTKAAPSRAPKNQGSRTPAVTDASAAASVLSARPPGGPLVNGDAVALPCSSDQTGPEPRLATAAKKQRGWRNFRRKKREPEVIYPENPPIQLTPPQETEDWEKEIQEVKLTDWEKMCFGVNDYGPEDLLQFALRDLTLKQTDVKPLPVTANYSPAYNHPRPLRWSCFSIPTEMDQFADAD